MKSTLFEQKTNISSKFQLTYSNRCFFVRFMENMKTLAQFRLAFTEAVPK